MIRAEPGAGRMIALTYDDGPSPHNTPELLHLLASTGARATFFVVGAEIQRYPEIATRIVAEGHELGNHSLLHQNPLELSDDALRSDIERADEILRDHMPRPALYRPPYGKRPDAASRLCRGLRLRTVLWSLDSGDSAGFSAARIAGEILRHGRPGDVVLLHDGGAPRHNTLEATAIVLRELGGRGYVFGTVSELLRAASIRIPTSPIV